MSKAVISMTKLGSLRRFANQLFQYAFLRTYARRHDLHLQVPSWIGNELFGLQDAPIDCELPEFVELYDKDPHRMVIPRLREPLRNVDFSGFFQYPTHYYRPDRQFIRGLFTPVPPIRRSLEAAFEKLRDSSSTIVALHLRRGDYGYRYFYITPVRWYLRWLDHHWAQLPNPLLYIATDEPDSVLPAFDRYSPLTSSDVYADFPMAPYYPDFFTLTRADVLVIPNSSFSFAAAMLNPNLQTLYRSRLSDPLQDPPFRVIDPWNAVPLDIDAEAENFPAVPGIRRDPPEILKADPKPKKSRMPWRLLKRA